MSPQFKDALKQELPKNFSFSMYLLALLLISLPFELIYIRYRSFSPFVLTGSEFTWFYTILSILVIISMQLLYKSKTDKITHFVRDEFPQEVNVFQLAYFLHGITWAAQTAIIDLIQKRFLEPADNKMFRIIKNDANEPVGNPFANALLLKKDGELITYEEIESKWYNTEEFTHIELQKLYDFIDRRYSSGSLSYFPLSVLILGLVFVFKCDTSDISLPIVITLSTGGFFLITGVFSSGYIINTTVGFIFWEKNIFFKKVANKVVTDYAINGERSLKRLPRASMLNSLFSTEHLRGGGVDIDQRN